MRLTAILASLVIGPFGMTASAQLPVAHKAAAEEAAATESGKTFIVQAFESARVNSPFANVVAAPTSYVSDLHLASRMADYASRFLGTRYILGATGPSAFDCSGFTSYIYRNFGIEIKRTSREQFTQGRNVNLADLQPGDLLFFSSRSSGRGRVGHVAMVASVDKENGTCRFIHASTKKGVTYQTFPDNAYYSTHFIGARRVLGTHADTRDI